jgi:protein-L-isoaspartate(D-aspartate) O-methyltransferase
MRPLLAIFLLVPLAVGGQDWERARVAMVRSQIEARGVRDPRVLAAMRAVPRHLFVPADLQRDAYGDHPLPIGDGQTISQPYIVALMSELAGLTGSETVLEVGPGSGYQAAILARLAKRVHTIEIKPGLHARASALLAKMGMANVEAVEGDGYFGLPSAAPFDAILVTAAASHVPPPLLAQLADGGRLVIPVGLPFSVQDLVLITRHGGATTVRHVLPVQFVPLTGRALDGGP